jgi:hypothetical protein
LSWRVAVLNGHARTASPRQCHRLAVLVIGRRIADPYLAVCVLLLGAAFNAFATGTYWATTIDVTREYSGLLSGLMNTASNIAGAISPNAYTVSGGTVWLYDRD